MPVRRGKGHTGAASPMAKSLVKTFRATLIASGMGLRSTFALLPFDLEKAWPGLRVRRVIGEINGFSFRTSLFPTPRGYGFVVNKKMLAGAGAQRGDRVVLRLEPDLEPRKEVLPEELVSAMRGAAKLRKWFEKLPPGHQRWIAHTVSEPKSEASRQKRAEEMADRLYLTMEGEKELPPILRAAFQRQPTAEAAWQSLTPVQRRNHLFMIYGCRSTESREKRVKLAIEQGTARLDPARRRTSRTSDRTSEDFEAEL